MGTLGFVIKTNAKETIFFLNLSFFCCLSSIYVIAEVMFSFISFRRNINHLLSKLGKLGKYTTNNISVCDGKHRPKHVIFINLRISQQSIFNPQPSNLWWFQNPLEYEMEKSNVALRNHLGSYCITG